MDNELLEQLILGSFTKRQLKVLLAIARKTFGYQKESDYISSSQLAEMTGLADTHCRSARRELVKLGVLYVKPGKYRQRTGISMDLASWRVGGLRTCEPNCPVKKPEEPEEPEEREESMPIPAELESPNQTESGEGEDLLFPATLSQKQLGEARNLLARIPAEVRQQTLDVLASLIQQNQIRKGPIATLAGIIRRWENGTFDPSPGYPVAERRARDAKYEGVRAKYGEVDNGKVLAEHAKLKGEDEIKYMERLTQIEGQSTPSLKAIAANLASRKKKE